MDIGDGDHCNQSLFHSGAVHHSETPFRMESYHVTAHTAGVRLFHRLRDVADQFLYSGILFFAGRGGSYWMSVSCSRDWFSTDCKYLSDAGRWFHPGGIGGISHSFRDGQDLFRFDDRHLGNHFFALLLSEHHRRAGGDGHRCVSGGIFHQAATGHDAKSKVAAAAEIRSGKIRAALKKIRFAIHPFAKII